MQLNDIDITTAGYPHGHTERARSNLMPLALPAFFGGEGVIQQFEGFVKSA
jgi:hypothetical protein